MFLLVQQALRDEEEQGPLSWVLGRQQMGRETRVLGRKRREGLRMGQGKADMWVGGTMAS